MSQGFACRCEGTRRDKMPNWVCTTYKANYSAFNGWAYAPSDYSAVRCTKCGSCWRTKAEYVALLRMEK